jgi:hypothetical protein
MGSSAGGLANPFSAALHPDCPASFATASTELTSPWLATEAMEWSLGVGFGLRPLRVPMFLTKKEPVLRYFLRISLAVESLMFNFLAVRVSDYFCSKTLSTKVYLFYIYKAATLRDILAYFLRSASTYSLEGIITYN